MESLPLLLPPPGVSPDWKWRERRDMGEEGQDGWIGGKTAPGKVRIYHAQNVVVSAVQDGGQDEREERRAFVCSKFDK